MKIRKVVIALFVLLLCISGCSKSTTDGRKKTTYDYETVYNTFIKQEIVQKRGLALLHELIFELELDKNSSTLATEQIVDGNLGVIGGYIVDLDKNQIPELILSYVDNTDENIGTLVVEIYTIVEGNVEEVETDSEKLRFEFFYNKCQGNLHVFLQEVNGQLNLCVLKAFERSFGTLYYDVALNVYCMEEGKIKQNVYATMAEDYRQQATEMAENLKEDVNLGNWFENEFTEGLGENGTGVFAPFDYALSTRDNSIVDIVRIRAVRENGIQSFQYFDYSSLRNRILYDEAYQELIGEKLLPEMGIVNNSFNTWGEVPITENWGEISEEDLGLISILEYDCNNDGVLEVLVFYLKQEMETSENTKHITQNLYIDLYTQKDNEAVLVGTVDVLKPVMPWTSVFAIEDSISAQIRHYKEHTYLYIWRESINEGPTQTAHYVYDLTDIESIQKCVYYVIADAGRLNGELMIPANIKGGSSGEHEFIVKVQNEETELYYEAVDGEQDESVGEMKFQTQSEAKRQIEAELLEIGVDLYVHDEEVTEIFSWYFNSDGIWRWVQIYDESPLKRYLELMESEATDGLSRKMG